MTMVIDRDIRLTPADSGVPLYFGRAALGDASSAWVFQCSPDQGSYDGTFAVMGCVIESPGAQAASGTNPNSPNYSDQFIPVPYRVGYADGAPGTWAMTDSITPLSGTFLIQVPANGLKIALMPSISTGSCVLRSQPVTVGTAP